MILLNITSVLDRSILPFHQINNIHKINSEGWFGKQSADTLMVYTNGTIVDTDNINPDRGIGIVLPAQDNIYIPVDHILNRVTEFYSQPNVNNVTELLCRIGYSDGIIDLTKNSLNQYESFKDKKIKGSIQIIPTPDIKLKEFGWKKRKIIEQLEAYNITLADDQILKCVKVDVIYTNPLIPLSRYFFLPKEMIGTKGSVITLTDTDGYTYTLYNL